MLEASRDVLQDFDGVLPIATMPAAIQPGRDSEDDDDEGVAENGEEEEPPSYRNRYASATVLHSYECSGLTS